MGSFTESDSEIAGERSAMTTRAARWVTFQVGKNGRSVKEVAAELQTDWHTVNNTVVAVGEQLLDADVDRVGSVRTLGVYEVLFIHQGKWRTQMWSTQIVDIQNGQLLDVIPDKTAAGLCAWLEQQPVSWRNRMAWAALDLSGPWRSAFDTMLPHATQVADPFHVVKLANLRLDECRRRTQNETLGHRGRKHDPLYRSRRLLTKAHERLSTQGEHKLMTLLERGDPKGEVRMTWHVKEAVRSFYDCDTVKDAEAYLDELTENTTDPSMPHETRQLGRTLRRWLTQLISWHKSRVSNGATEGINNMIKRVTYGLTSFRNYRIRSLLYAGKPNWKLLPTITAPPNTRSPDLSALPW